jgi:ABC-type tungstate transport system substrate-binding protein
MGELPLRLTAVAAPTTGGEPFEFLLIWNQLTLSRQSTGFKLTAVVDSLRVSRVRRLDGRRVTRYAVFVVLPLVTLALGPILAGQVLGIGVVRFPAMIETSVTMMFLAAVFAFPVLLPAALVRRRRAVRIELSDGVRLSPDQRIVFLFNDLEFWLDDRVSPGLERIVGAIECHMVSGEDA